MRKLLQPVKRLDDTLKLRGSSVLITSIFNFIHANLYRQITLLDSAFVLVVALDYPLRGLDDKTMKRSIGGVESRYETTTKVNDILGTKFAKIRDGKRNKESNLKIEIYSEPKSDKICPRVELDPKGRTIPKTRFEDISSA